MSKGDRIGIAARNSANWGDRLYGGRDGGRLRGPAQRLLDRRGTGRRRSRSAGCTLVLADPQRAARIEGCGREAIVLTFSHGVRSAGRAGGADWRRAAARIRPCRRSARTTSPRSCSPRARPASPRARSSDHRGGGAGDDATSRAQTLMVLGHMADARAGSRSIRPRRWWRVPLFHVTGESPAVPPELRARAASW